MGMLGLRGFGRLGTIEGSLGLEGIVLLGDVDLIKESTTVAGEVEGILAGRIAGKENPTFEDSVLKVLIGIPKLIPVLLPESWSVFAKP